MNIENMVDDPKRKKPQNAFVKTELMLMISIIDINNGEDILLRGNYNGQ